jgi:glutathione transport system ATP-binding protein
MNATTPSADTVLDVRDLSVCFGDKQAVDDVSFSVRRGETLAIVGESGSGKSVTALSIMRLLEQGTRGRITGGEIWLDSAGGRVELVEMPERDLRGIRGNDVSMIFQEPLTCLNPVYTVGDQIAEAMRRHMGLGRKAAAARALEMMELVRIPEARRRLHEYPHQMSGGMRQRVMIAMALACEPRVLIADEPTTALDVTIQAQILALIDELRSRTGTSVVFITHDMGVVAEIADRVLVMRRSKAVEEGTVEDIFDRPQHPYTRALLSAVPRLGSMTGTDSPRKFDMVEEVGA